MRCELPRVEYQEQRMHISLMHILFVAELRRHVSCTTMLEFQAKKINLDPFS